MFVFRPNFIPRAVVLIGCGGTGSRIVPPLIQLLRSAQQKHNPSGFLLAPIPLVLVDGDVVETKNLLRQNFSPKDVGVNKALALANRYSNAWGEPIYTVTKFVDSAAASIFSHLSEPLARPLTYENAIFILAVDSPEARRLLLSNIFLNSAKGKCFIIDPGNEDDFGQVRYFTNSFIGASLSAFKAEALFDKIPDRDVLEVRTPNIPAPIANYLMMGKSAHEVSCAGLPQTLAINNIMASLVVGVVQNFLFLKPMKHDCLRYSLSNGTSADTNSVHRWMERGMNSGALDIPYVPGGGKTVATFDTGSEKIELDESQLDFARVFWGSLYNESLDFSYRHYTGPDGVNVDPPIRGSYASELGGINVFKAYAVKAKAFYAERKMDIIHGKVVPRAEKVAPPPMKAVAEVEAAPTPPTPPKAPRRRAPVPPILPSEVTAAPPNEGPGIDMPF